MFVLLSHALSVLSGVHFASDLECIAFVLDLLDPCFQESHCFCNVFLLSGATRFHRHEAMVSKLLLGFQLELYDEEGILAEGFSRQLAVEKSL